MKIQPSITINERFDLQTNKGRDMAMTDELAEALGDIFVLPTGLVLNCNEFNRLTQRPAMYYQSESSPWNSHNSFVTVELPNPALDMKAYQFIRDIFLKEIQRIIERKPRPVTVAPPGTFFSFPKVQVPA